MDAIAFQDYLKEYVNSEDGNVAGLNYKSVKKLLKRTCILSHID